MTALSAAAVAPPASPKTKPNFTAAAGPEALVVETPKVRASGDAAASYPSTAGAVDAGRARTEGVDAIAKLSEFEEILKDFRAKESNKAFRNQTRKTINTKIAQISSSVKQITEITGSLIALLTEAEREGDKDRQRFVQLSLADRFFDEAEVNVRSGNTGRAAWPVAYVATQVFSADNLVELLFRGYVHKACPYLLPDFTSSHASSRQVGRLPAAGQRLEESAAAFAERMVGYARLWFAVSVLQGNLALVWRWFATALNARPSAICAALVLTALELTGAAAQQRYQRQFKKLVAYIHAEYLPGLELELQQCQGEEANKLRANQARLRHWLADFARSGQCPAPEGQDIRVTQEAELNPDI